MLPERVDSYAFIAKGPGLNPVRDSAVFKTRDFRMQVVGVESVETAIEAATQLVSDGVQLIDLCSSFDSDQANRIRTAISHSVPVCIAVESETLGVRGFSTCFLGDD